MKLTDRLTDELRGYGLSEYPVARRIAAIVRDAKLDRAANEGKRLLREGKQGSEQALCHLREKLRLTRWEIARSSTHHTQRRGDEARNDQD